MYLHGHGVRRSTVQADIWFEKAARQGYAEAQYNHALMLDDPEQALPWLRKAAISDHPAALVAMGKRYETGQGVKKNLRRARELYTRAANANLADAQYTLARLLEKHKNPGQALKWYLRAAEQGHIPSQTSAGVMYEMGNGTERDPARALFWYNLAASEGDMIAMRHRNRLAPILDQQQRERARQEVAQFETSSLSLTLQREQLFWSRP